MENNVLDQFEQKTEGIKNLQEVLNNGYEFKFSQYFSRGGELYGMNVGGFAGFTILLFLIGIVGSLISSFIPLGNQLFSLLVSTPLALGFIIATFNLTKGNTNFDQFWRGFEFFKPAVLASLIRGLIIVFPAVLIVFIAFGAIYSITDLIADPTGFFQSLFMDGFPTGFILIYLLLMIFLVVMYTIYSFSSYFIVLHKFDAWSSLEASRKIISKKFFYFLGILIVLGFINLFGALFLGIGLLFTIPYTICILYASFEDIMGVDKSPTTEQLIEGETTV